MPSPNATRPPRHKKRRLTEAQQALVDDNRPFAIYMADRLLASNGYLRAMLPTEDAHSAALLGMSRAAFAYDPERGVRFITFSARPIKQEIWREARQQHIVFPPRWDRESPIEATRLAEARARAPYARLDLQDWGRSADRLGAEAALARMRSAVEEDSGPDIDLRILRRAMAKLPGQWQEVLTRTYWAGKSTREIAEELGVSRSRIWSVKQRALVRMEKLLRQQGVRA